MKQILAVAPILPGQTASDVGPHAAGSTPPVQARNDSVTQTATSDLIDFASESNTPTASSHQTQQHSQSSSNQLSEAMGGMSVSQPQGQKSSINNQTMLPELDQPHLEERHAIKRTDTETGVNEEFVDANS